MKIICIGRNYLDHIREMNSDIPTSPVFFMKSENALIYNDLPFFIPDFSSNIEYECELVIRICKMGKMIDEKFAHKYYDAVSLGIDFTARDLQKKCIQNGEPWEIAKAFDSSAPVGKFIDLKPDFLTNGINFKLEKNGITVQKSNSNNMIFSFNKIISHLSKYITLKTGDIIFTGTPQGVGKVEKDDLLTGWIEDELILSVSVK
ncbi:MAG: fumarylacetoacetate hydrolase family protein [Bacteroidales bacterium]|nr:fumarylacetoacetate hydrolase family protein [Bacteroidales bacterium]